MKPTTEILARISQNSLANKEEVFTKLYRYLLRPDIYFVAYKNLYANNGAATKGVNEDTADGFSEAKIDSIIKALADETYQPMPVRRTYIQKKNNCALPGFVDSKNEEKTERNAGYLVVSQSGGGMLRQGTREGIRRTPANRGMRAHRIVKGLDISEDVCHGMCP